MDRPTQKALADSGDLGAIQAYAAGSLPEDPFTALKYYGRASELGSAAALGEIASHPGGAWTTCSRRWAGRRVLCRRACWRFVAATRTGNCGRTPSPGHWRRSGSTGPSLQLRDSLALVEGLAAQWDSGVLTAVCGQSLAILAKLSAATAGRDTGHAAACLCQRRKALRPASLPGHTGPGYTAPSPGRLRVEPRNRQQWPAGWNCGFARRTKLLDSSAAMDVTRILDPLNDAQREAVTAPQQPMLVVAGAGSGKTRVLVHRIAWLIQVERVSPLGILAVTFTNKAAAEMRGRVQELLDMPVNHLWIGTFHGLAHRLLRRHAQDAGLPEGFQILDADDQQRLIRRLLKNLDLDETTWVPREVQWFINHHKDEGKRPGQLTDDGDQTRRQLIQLYRLYQENCDKGGLVDFAELLLRAFELWKNNPELLAQYRRRFRHILVDEFQDTNAIQYAWLRLLAGDSGVPFVVGDDDQSIYRWRGARQEHLRRFQKDFPGSHTVKLEQNYRSTKTILSAANAIIGHNTRPARQGTLDVRRRRHADPAVPGLQRAG